MTEQRKAYYLTVSNEETGQRLDNFLLKHLKGAPRTLIYRIVRSGEVRINKGRASVSDRVNHNDQIRIPPLRLADAADETATQAHSNYPVLPILFEDDALLVINKPAGLAVHGGSGIALGIIEQLRALRPQAAMLELVHRLDRDTSGILLVAKKRAALVALHEQFRTNHAVEKHYLALVSGVFPDARRNIRFKLFKANTTTGERRVYVSPDGQEAHTILKRAGVYTDEKNTLETTLLQCELKTGRTHQIRVHCAHSGFPILGDDKYGDFTLNKKLSSKGLKRMFLHAWRLSFSHPISTTRLQLEAPLPKELQRYLDSLKKVI